MAHQPSLQSRKAVLQPNSRSKVKIVGVLAATLLVVAGLISLYVGGFLNNLPHNGTEERLQEDSVDAEVIASEFMVVNLSEGKLATVDIQCESVTSESLIHSHHLPGRVTYDDNRHIDVTAPTSGILTEVLVKPGDKVSPGQILAWLNSPEIGSARADVLQFQSRVELTSRLLDRAHTVEKNVLALTSALKEHPEFNALKDRFSDRILGDYREKLFVAYAQMLLHESLAKKSIGAADSGALSGKVMQERQTAAQSAREVLNAAIEQAELDVWKERPQVEVMARDAQRRLQIARQNLASLLLNESVIRPNSEVPDPAKLGASDEKLQQLSQVAVRAPFAGTIERRSFSAGERVRAANSMFVLADTSSLWIQAEIRENDWPAILLKEGQSLAVTVPALEGRTFQAIVEYVGREVAPNTNAIPIVARVDNSERRLRPGLFVRVSVPISSKSDVLTAPKRAVLEQDGQLFVFVTEKPNQFRRVNVTTGEESEERIEISSGLNTGDQVVTQGAFILKSELLLEGEDE